MPLGAIREIRIGVAESEQRLGFSSEPEPPDRRSAPELQRAPARGRRELEQCAAALGLGVAEIAGASSHAPRATPP